MKKIFIILSLFIILIFIFKPKFLESVLRKNHYASKDKIVKKYIIPNLLKINRVLDFGSGSGALAHALSNRTKLKVIPLDIIDISEYGKKPVIYDGEKIPFDNNYFDISICLFVLHHIPNQIAILKELIRVTKYRIIIMEDVVDSFLDNILTNIHSYSSYGKCSNCFHSTAEWINIFKKNGLKISKVNKVPRSMLPIYPVSRKLFILDK